MAPKAQVPGLTWLSCLQGHRCRLPPESWLPTRLEAVNGGCVLRIKDSYISIFARATIRYSCTCVHMSIKVTLKNEHHVLPWFRIHHVNSRLRHRNVRRKVAHKGVFQPFFIWNYVTVTRSVSAHSHMIALLFFKPRFRSLWHITFIDVMCKDKSKHNEQKKELMSTFKI